MSTQASRFPKWVTQAAAGVVIGLVLALAIGWWLWPVQYTNTAPDVLRQDYHDDYVVMVATAYEVDGDLEQVRTCLELLDPEEPTVPLVELAERLVQANGSREDITRLANLAQALGALSPALVPYVEGQP